jgi:hypothetical protein
MFDASPSRPNGAAMKAKRDEGLKKIPRPYRIFVWDKKPRQKET